MIFGQVIYGLIAIALGTVTLKYNYQIVNNTTRLEFFESKIGSGSTYTVYKLLSLLLIIGGILYMVGFGDDVLEWLLSPVVKFFQA